MIWKRKLSLVLIVLLILPCASGAVVPRLDFGPFFSRDKAIDGNFRLRILGPFFEKQTAKDGSEFLAVRPFYSSVKKSGDGRCKRDIVWPFGGTLEHKDRDTWRIFPFGGWSSAEGNNQGWRFYGFPLVLTGSTRDGEGFFALFPIGGVLKDTLFRDRISFVLFPVYLYSVINDVETWDVLWPFISWTRGEGVSRFRVFPFYGMSEREGRWRKEFILWPIWTAATYSLPGASGSAHMLFPLYGHAVMENQEAWWFLPPFFRWSKGEDRKVVNCPWPIIQYASGDLNKFYIWPLYGRKSIENLKTGFLLWPVILWERVDRGQAGRKRFMVFPLYYREIVAEQSAAGEVVSRYTKLWPLVSYRREGDVSRIAAPELWPGKQYSAIDRNFAPIWTLYSRVKAGDAVEHEALWGLFRKKRGDDGSHYVSLFPFFSAGGDGKGGKEWKFLFGLLGYEREKLHKTYRLLYFPIKVGGKNDHP